jgi:hypothetical protein
MNEDTNGRTDGGRINGRLGGERFLLRTNIVGRVLRTSSSSLVYNWVFVYGYIVEFIV